VTAAGSRPTIAVLGTLDTKGLEHAFVAAAIRDRGCAPLVIDTSPVPGPLPPEFAGFECLRVRGDAGLAAADRGTAVAAVAAETATLVAALARAGRIQGVIALGGSGGTAIATAAMRGLPIGLPKLMVSTLAGGDVSAFVGTSDIVMMPSLVDVAGLNRVSRQVFLQAAAAVCGMAQARAAAAGDAPDRPLVVASMFGNTTRCVDHAREILERAGYEVLVFHATGAGGRLMEAIIASGIVAGVLDVTTTEWADELVGGILGAGPHRLEAAARLGVPAVVAPGCLDMVNFGPRDTVPARFRGRTFYEHSPQVTLMRTTAAECRELGRIVAEKLSASVGPVCVEIPRRAISVISAAGQPFADAEADRALFDALRGHLRPGIPCIEHDLEINDPTFATRCANQLLGMLDGGRAMRRLLG
jgi:uncharacterized protein (UPF0261 family)